MKSKLVSLTLIFAVMLTPLGAFAQTVQGAEKKPDVMHDIFRDIDDVDSEAKAEDLPYNDGTFLSDIREPYYISESGGEIFGADNSSAESLSGYSVSVPALNSGNVMISGKTYNLNGEFKIIKSYEGDFSGSGRKSEIAFIIAAKIASGGSLLLLCTAEANLSAPLSPIAVLYNSEAGSSDFYSNVNSFINCIAIVCADINGDGFDEIITTSPTSGLGQSSSDAYGFDKNGGSFVWSLREKNADWKSSAGWCEKPESLYNGIRVLEGNCYLGAPGVTASADAADIDGDGYDDVVTSVSTTYAKYNANYASNLFSVYYIGGAPTVSEMMAKRKALMIYADSSLKLGPTSGDASGFEVKISDVDGSGKPTIFVSFKETVHHWASLGKDKMFIPKFHVLSFDYVKNSGSFVSSRVHSGGIYHSGLQFGSAEHDDPAPAYKADTEDCAPLRMGILKNDFGFSEGKKGFVSSGTIVLDQKYISFVRYPDGNKYRYEIKDNGSYIENTDKYSRVSVYGDEEFEGKNCVYFDNGINVTEIRAAKVTFNGGKYGDAAMVAAYDANGRYRTYFLTSSGKGYLNYENVKPLASGKRGAAVAMPDADNDSVYLKYKQHVFFWADPVIIAALASPPYFDSLPSDMYKNSQTTYGKSASQTSGESESYSVSAGAYISVEIKGGGGGVSGVFESESEAMKNSTLESEETKEVTYTQSFSTSGGEDTVVLATVGYDAYAYTAYYPGENGEFKETDYVVYVPRNGADAMKIASLNYEDYLELVPYSNEALPDLRDVFTHTVGKPETYPKNTSNINNALNGSIMEHKNLSTFPSNFGSQTLSVDITEETAETSSTGSSVSSKLGGGVEVEAEGIFNLVDTGTKVTGGAVSEKEHGRGRITTKAVGTSYEGTVFGQGDGMNVSGSGEQKAGFNWRLLHYIYDFKEDNFVQQFPVITYIIPRVDQPEGVIPASVSVTPSSQTVEQVGPKTEGHINSANFSVTSPGVTREAYTALEGAPLGMTLDTGGANIGSGGPFAFSVKINGNVKPGVYPLKLNIGGVLSNEFKLTVKEYEAPVWIEADKTELDFGSMRYSYSRGTPSADAQTVTVKNIHSEKLEGFYAELDENSDFEIINELSARTLYAKDLANSEATIGIAPKKGLDIGTHTGTLTVTNGVTAAYVSLKYVVTEPGPPGPPDFSDTWPGYPTPVSISVNPPVDDGGGKIEYYLYTLKDVDEYMENGGQKWVKYYGFSKTSSFFLSLGDLEVDKTYTIGMKIVTDRGESEAAWHDFKITYRSGRPNPPQNVKVYPRNKGFAITWDQTDFWGVPEDQDKSWFKYYTIRYAVKSTTLWDVKTVMHNEELEYTVNNLENGAEYEVIISAGVDQSSSSDELYFTVVPSEKAEITPSRPSGLKAEMSYKTAKLSWNEPGATGGETLSYEVSSDGGETWENAGEARGYTFENLITNKEYEFRVRGKNSIGAGDYSKTVQTAPPKLAAPDVEKGAVAGYEQLEVAWNEVKDSGVLGYEVKLDNGEWQKITPIKFGGKLRYTFKGLKFGDEHVAYVRAYDAEGGGLPANTYREKINSLAPPPVKNPYIVAKNGKIVLYGESPSEDVSMSYFIDGVDSRWWRFSNGLTIGELENGKTYTVGISTSSRDENGFELRTTQYLTATPDASVPDPPSEPKVNARIGDGYIYLQWEVESDGGEPIEYYIVSFGENSGEISLPAGQNSFLISYAPEEKDKYSEICVTAVNSVGESNGWLYLNSGREVNLKGESSLIVPGSHGSSKSAPYALEVIHEYEDDNGNLVKETMDASSWASWSIESPNSEIGFDSESREILIGENLADGEYEAAVLANLWGTVYERKVKVIVGGESARIISAACAAGGIKAELYLPESFGGVTLFAAAYNSSGMLLKSAKMNVSAGALNGGTAFIPINLDGAAYVKIMLIKDEDVLQPLCESLRIAASYESAKIISAEKASGGIEAELYLPESFGEVTLLAAAYNSSGMLLNSAQKKTSANSSDNGKILVPINLDGAAYAKAMLFKDMNSVQPVAESRRITLN